MTTPTSLLEVDGVLNALPDSGSDLFAWQQRSDGCHVDRVLSHDPIGGGAHAAP